MKTKTFDAVELQHQGGLRIHELTKDMTLEEKLAFWQQKTDLMLKRRQELLDKKQAEDNCEEAI